MDELKPCPFCGGEVTLKKYENPFAYTDSAGNTFWRDEPDGWMIECKNHGWNKDAKGVDVAADIALYSWDMSEESKIALIEAWNTRAERTCSLTYDGVDEAWQGEELYPVNTVRCTACGSLVYDVNAMKYCPVCGARVISEVE